MRRAITVLAASVMGSAPERIVVGWRRIVGWDFRGVGAGLEVEVRCGGVGRAAVADILGGSWIVVVMKDLSRS